jgi:hypothetical protein
MIKKLILFTFLCLASILHAEWPDSSKVNFCLPPVIIAQTGNAISIFFEGITINKNLSRFHFIVSCSKGSYDSLKWSFNPAPSDTGEFDFKISAFDDSAHFVESDSARLRVYPASIQSKDTTNLLMIGNSMTFAGIMSIKLTELMYTTPGPFKTYGTVSINDSVKVEHGSRWAFFLADGSPFYLYGIFDYNLYLQFYFLSQIPNRITIELGINDCFGSATNNTSIESIDNAISKMLISADSLIQQFKAVTPDVKIGVCLIPTPSIYDSAFVSSYPGMNISRWGWKKVHYRIMQNYLNDFGNRNSEGIYAVQTNLSIDPLNDYNPDNAIHPNPNGYNHMGVALFNWLNSLDNESYNSSLPVELTSFAASVIKNIVSLKWKTATEINSSSFEIEKKINNNSWKKIASVHASGNKSSPSNYSFNEKMLIQGNTVTG